MCCADHLNVMTNNNSHFFLNADAFANETFDLIFNDT